MRQTKDHLLQRIGTGMAVSAILWLLAGCAGRPVGQTANADRELPSDVAKCQATLAGEAPADSAELDAASIRLLNWNAQKNKRLNWQSDLKSLASDKNLVLVQEVSLRKDSINAIDSSRHWSFAPGYRSGGAVSGVLTLSTSKPIAQCSFVNYEPVLRSPKATVLTKYGLTTTDQELIVVNLHAVNFSMGLGAFQRQFEQVRQILEAHDGPVILSGDFNTWRRKRAEVVADLAQSLGLTALGFAKDHRVKKFGNYIDHIYIRGLSPLSSSTSVVDSSDHNPMSATLAL